jgi:hypothetical protein
MDKTRAKSPALIVILAVVEMPSSTRQMRTILKEGPVQFDVTALMT